MYLFFMVLLFFWMGNVGIYEGIDVSRLNDKMSVIKILV